MADEEAVSLENDFHVSSDINLDVEGDIRVQGISSDDEDTTTLDEPISVTLKRDLNAIGKKFMYVLVPRQSTSLLRDWDLWGPLILCIILASLLQSSSNMDGSPEFAQVFAIVWLGASVVTVNSKLLGGNISFFQSVCVLGYCVLPLTLALVACKILLALAGSTSTTIFAIRCAIVVATLVWSCFASLAFLGDTQPHNRKPLAVYPICLFYLFISWMVVSHNG